MPLLRPGDPFPELMISTIGGPTSDKPSDNAPSRRQTSPVPVRHRHRSELR